MDSFDRNATPKEIRAFVIRYVDSIELVNVLKLLHGSPNKEWSSEQISNELRSSVAAIEKRLHDLYARGLLRTRPGMGTHSFTPFDAHMQREIENFLKYNEVYPYRVIELIFERRDDALREFANAFDFKKEGKK